jgi:hypothetical protein
MPELQAEGELASQARLKAEHASTFFACALANYVLNLTYSAAKVMMIRKLFLVL